MQDFRRLTVWSDAHALTLELYGATRDFPDSERFGLTSQLRRASASIPANLAEGCGRGGDADFARFVQIALGSTYEVEYHLQLAHDLGYLKQQKIRATRFTRRPRQTHALGVAKETENVKGCKLRAIGCKPAACSLQPVACSFSCPAN